jgi:hypothetical protein
VPGKVFSLVKIFFFHAAHGRKHQWRQGATCRRKIVRKRQGGGLDMSARLRCRARGHHAPGLFRHLADSPERGKTDATSLSSWRKPEGPAQAPMGLHMDESGLKSKGRMLQCNKNRAMAALALPCPRDYHKPPIERGAGQ